MDTHYDLDGNLIRIIQDSDGQTWYSITDILKALGYAFPTAHVLERLDKQEVATKYISTRGGPQAVRFTTLQGLKKLIAASRKPKAITFAHFLGIEIRADLDPTKEQHTLAIISAAFAHLTQLHQYSVGKYRIDLYFPEQHIAVECDEQWHQWRMARKEKARQQFLEKALQCTFVRYNPDAKNFNVGSVINQIICILAK